MLGQDELTSGWTRLGVAPGEVLLVHASLSSLRRVDGGAAAVVASLRRAIGDDGTLVMPAFTPQVRDPVPDASDPTDPEVVGARGAVPLFDHWTPSSMGSIAEAFRASPGTVRSRHPQVSIAAAGPRAAEIVAPSPLAFAVGPGSPLDVVRRVGGRVLLLGVGYNRLTYFHHAETLCAHRRFKLRRFPLALEGERVWVEVPDVADDLDTHFPVVGEEYERTGAVLRAVVGAATVRLLEAQHVIAWAAPALEDALARKGR